MTKRKTMDISRAHICKEKNFKVFFSPIFKFFIIENEVIKEYLTIMPKVINKRDLDYFIIANRHGQIRMVRDLHT